MSMGHWLYDLTGEFRSTGGKTYPDTFFFSLEKPRGLDWDRTRAPV